MSPSTASNFSVIEGGDKKSKVDMPYLVRALVKFNASDLHLKTGRPPLYRINGKLIAAKMAELSSEQVQSILYGILTERQVQELKENLQIDFSFKVADLGRFRCNVFYQRTTLSAAIRLIPFNVPNLDDLGIPIVVKDLLQRPRGLILVTGATGSGKSTTLAAMVQHLNETSQCHILTVEDPIEYVYRDIKASVTQREVGSDTHTLQDALYGGLRQDPDVIMIGEMRDYETIRLALTAAETGHLVLSTLHTNDAKSTVERILDVFPPDAQNQIRIQLATTLIGVISQQLLVRADGSGRAVATEVMIKSPAIENYILKNEMARIPEAIASSNAYYKMHTMNQAIEKLVRQGIVTADEALKASTNADELRLKFQGFTRS